jgi:hypothetical protein
MPRVADRPSPLPEPPRIGHVASLHQCSLVRPPIADAIFRLVLRMNPRLHGEIVSGGHQQGQRIDDRLKRSETEDSCTNADS